MRKLKYNLINAEKKGYDTLLTFGGAYSNHIYAVAAAGNIFGFNTIGVIRGEPYKILNPTLTFAKEKGMHLHYLSRNDYQQKYSAENIQNLKNQFGSFYMLPEGGTNNLAIKGCTEIVDETDLSFDYIASSCGTGGTLAGIIAGLNGQKKIIGFSALKGGAFFLDDIKKHIYSYSNKTYFNWQIETEFHFGGYAKYTTELINFINTFKREHSIPLDPIYTGKMVFGLLEMIKNGDFKSNITILAVHTGGLQGIIGFNERFGKLIK